MALCQSCNDEATEIYQAAELALQTCIYAPIYLFFIMYVCSSYLDSSIAQNFGDNLEKVHSMKRASYVDNVSNLSLAASF